MLRHQQSLRRLPPDRWGVDRHACLPNDDSLSTRAEGGKI
jgi:hypothetical protein